MTVLRAWRRVTSIKVHVRNLNDKISCIEGELKQAILLSEDIEAIDMCGSFPQDFLMYSTAKETIFVLSIVTSDIFHNILFWQIKPKKNCW